MEQLTRFFLLWGAFSSGVLGYSNGKVSAACSSMVPGHAHSAQTSVPPYAISVSKTSFAPGDEIIVSLTASGDSSFEGFLLQAQRVGGDVAVGHFRILDPNSQGLACNGIQNSSVSHTNKAKKQNITAIWIAPPDAGHVEFRATALQNFSVFWTQVQSQVLISSRLALVPTASSTTISTEEECGKHKFCFSNPAGCNPSTPNCYFMSSAALGSHAFQFEMSGLSDGYVAIGFSDDTMMGDDDVYICAKNAADHVEVQHAFSTGYTAPSPMPLGDVDVLTTSFNEGIIRCSFISRNPISTQPRSIDSLYYVFLAFGPSTADGSIRKHSRTPFITGQKVNISSFAAVGGTSSTPLIIKAHGALMLIAWMTTGSVGMIFARYLKKSIKKPLLGKDTWFQIHFLMMLLTVAATAVSFILIFVAANGWSESAGAHAVIGCIVMILALLQPAIAFFRPSLQDNRRFIFNWFHMLNALVIKVLAVAAIFLGLRMLSSSPSQWMVKTMGGFVVWEVLAAILMDVTLWLKRKEMHDDSNTKVKSEMLLLLVYLCGNLAFLIALLVGIGSS